MGEIEEILDEVDIKYNRLKNFDVIRGHSHPYDHHYFQRTSFVFGNKHSKSNIYNIKHREWELLENHLPKSIYVRVYENDDYVDLMRAVIVGPQGTPYCYSLFFFDICIPSGYPNSPPKVYYHSHGYNINPNLRDDGTVCHHLLDGKGMWNSTGSSLLQVLKSIQISVLSGKPFLSKPVLENEVFQLSCKKMVRTLDNPPRHFEDFVKGHFRLYSHLILLSCKKYIDNGAKMGKWVEYLYQNFEANGSYVKHHKHLLDHKGDEEENQREGAGKAKSDALNRTWMNWMSLVG